VQIHPRLVTAIRTLSVQFAYVPCAVSRNMAFEAASALGLAVRGWTACGAPLLAATVDDRNLKDAVAKAIVQDRLTAADGSRVFSGRSPAGQHALRMAGRAAALRSIRTSRYDAEGSEDIDLAANLDPKIRRWSSRLSPEKASLWRIFRGGAMWTPTRRWSLGRAGEGPEETETCRYCGHPRASARHLVVECDGTRQLREEVGRRYGIAAAWWHQQPRVAVKSGWITRSAARTYARRVQLVQAIGELAIEIMRRTAHWRPQPGQQQEVA
jgi:hypothetical protein